MSSIAKDSALHRLPTRPATADENTAMIDELFHKGVERIYPPNGVVQREGDAVQSVKLLKAGWIVSEIHFTNGSRLITDFFLPRDIVQLPTIRGTARASARTVDFVRVSEIPLPLFLEALERNPQLATTLNAASVRAKAAQLEHMVRLGGLSTMARTAHLILELSYRLHPANPPGGLSFLCPLKQSDLADALGMTPIHVNRILRKLRALGLMSLDRKIVVIRDRDRLCRLAEFNAGYLQSDDEAQTSQNFATAAGLMAAERSHPNLVNDLHQQIYKIL